MNSQKKKRAWVMPAIIVFLAVLLVLTFFSNTINNASLPEVGITQISGGTITAKIRGDGTISANETYDVTIKETRTIASVLIKEGQQVEVGDTLFLLEAAESSELQEAEKTLSDLQLAYDKALLEASNSASKSNYDVSQAQTAYNEALSTYHVYSSMDPSQLTASAAAAESALKVLQRQQEQAEDAYNEALNDEVYTTAQQTVSTLQTKIENYDTQITDLQEQIDNYSSEADNSTALQRQIEEKNKEITAAKTTYNSDWAVYGTVYHSFLNLISDRFPGCDVQAKALGYANDTVRMTQDLGLSNTAGQSGSGSAGNADQQTEYSQDLSLYTASEYAVAYLAITNDSKKIEDLQDDLDDLYEDLSRNNTAAADSYNALLSKLDQAKADRAAAQSDLNIAEQTLTDCKANIAALKQASADARTATEDKQAELDQLNLAVTAADTVKSTRQTLSDLVMQSSLDSGTSLDLEAQQKAIEAQQKKVDELTANEEGLEVTAKAAGTVSAINTSAGKTAGPQEVLAVLNVTDRGYTVSISCTAEQAKKVKAGDMAEPVNYSSSDVTSELEEIKADPANPGKGKLLVFRLDGDVTPGQTITLSIGQSSSNYDALVPNSAVKEDNNGKFVLVVTSKATPLSTRYTATRVDVTVLATDDKYTAVSGISAGEYVITSSTARIEAGTQVRLAD